MRCWLRQRPCDVIVGAFFHERALPADDHTQASDSLGKTLRVRTLHGFASAVLALARAREGEFAREPTHGFSAPKNLLYV